MFDSTIATLKLDGKAKPFGAHFITKLEGVNSKLVCALSRICLTCEDGNDPPPKGPSTCVDDA
jgi:hypothetical protein